MRIKSEFAQAPGVAWVTAGREMENYVDAITLEKAIRAAHPTANKVISAGQYGKCLRYRCKGSKHETEADKVKVARQVTNQPAVLDVLDLERMVGKTAEFIRSANGGSPG